MKQSLIVFLSLLISNMAFAQSNVGGATGDRAHGLMSTLQGLPVAKDTGPTRIFENLNCERATILIDINAPEQTVKNYPMEDYIGCTDKKNATGLALKAFVGASANQVGLMTGWMANPRVVEAKTFPIKSVECWFYSDRCLINY